MSVTRPQAQDDTEFHGEATGSDDHPVIVPIELRECFPSNTALDESQPIILGNSRLIQPHEFHTNQERYFSRFQAACEALQDCALNASETDAWKFYSGTGFGLSPPWWAFWRVVDIPELMVKIRLGVPSLTAVILGNKASASSTIFELADLQHLPNFPPRSVLLSGSYFLFLTRTIDAAVTEAKGYIGKSWNTHGIATRINHHERIINRGGKVSAGCESYLYAYGTDPNTSLESAGIAYRNFCSDKVDYLSQVVEGINAIIFDMIVFDVPGRGHYLCNSPVVKRLIYNIRQATELIMADGIKLPSLNETSLNRSFPFTEPIDFNGTINHQEQCSVPDCHARAEYYIIPMNPLHGSVCSEHKPDKISRECHHCGLPADPAITDTPFRVSMVDRKRRCVPCVTNKPRQWYRWDTAEATARLLFPEFREYHLARLRAIPPNERSPDEKICALCLHIYANNKTYQAKCRHCREYPTSCNTSELRDWSLNEFQPDGGREKWFRETAISLRQGIGFIPYFQNKPNAACAFMSGVTKIPDPTGSFWSENVTFMKERGVSKVRRILFPETCQRLLDLKAEGLGWKSMAEEIGNIDAAGCKRFYLQLTTTSETWTTANDKLLLELVDFFGTQWVEIERHFFRKPADECAKRHEELISSMSGDIHVDNSPIRAELIIDMHFEIDVSNKSFRVVSSGHHTKEPEA